VKDELIKIGWWGKHFGEEPVLVGTKKQGAGAIFFTGCNLRCVFCQNYQISQQGFFKKKVSSDGLAELMILLQKNGAANIDLVTPTIWFPRIREAILGARKKGLSIPIIWNSNGCESVRLLEKMEGLVDIYLPDFKYGDDGVAFKYSGVKNYVKIAENAIKEMLRQTGNLITKRGIARKGIIVRHLVLPGNIENSFKVLEKLARIDNKIHLSLMNQYIPLFGAKSILKINQPLPEKDFRKVFNFALGLGFRNGWIQAKECKRKLTPDFKMKDPFKF